MSEWRPVAYQPSGCGVLGILRKEGSPRVRGEEVVRAIERVRYRGSDRGAGFAVFTLGGGGIYRVQVFTSRDPGDLVKTLSSSGLNPLSLKILGRVVGSICSCEIEVTASNVARLKKILRDLNKVLWPSMEGRIYSAGRSLRVFKGVGYPSDIASQYSVEGVEGDLWLAHTRQPTNSPGHYPYWSHPFAFFDTAVVHNGDLSSFGANVEFLRSRGWDGFVGTDSEVIAMLFEELLGEGFSIEDAVRILANPPKRSGVLPPEEDHMYRGARLDGPFTAVIGHDSGDDLYLIAIADRSKFRPVIIGEDEHRYYVASEENEVRELSPGARVWTLKPGHYFIASMRRGVISLGRPGEELKAFSKPPLFSPPHGFDIDARYMDYRELNAKLAALLEFKREVRVANLMGHRYVGINLPRAGVRGARIVLYGVVGNCLANLNEANEFYVHGNVGDDCGDTMHGGKIVITGDARDVLAQALQGGRIYVGGSAGNRVGIQMREYRDRRPYLVIGGRVDDYLGEYMAGGVIVILNAKGLSEPVGNFVGSGMVGGRIYIRGRIPPSKIGPQPPRVEMLRFIRAMVLEGLITAYQAQDLEDLSYPEILARLEGDARAYARKLLEERIGIPGYEYRELEEHEYRELLPVIRDYSSDLGGSYEELLKDRFTIVAPRSPERR